MPRMMQEETKSVWYWLISHPRFHPGRRMPLPLQAAVAGKGPCDDWRALEGHETGLGDAARRDKVERPRKSKGLPGAPRRRRRLPIVKGKSYAASARRAPTAPGEG